MKWIFQSFMEILGDLGALVTLHLLLQAYFPSAGAPWNLFFFFGKYTRFTTKG